MDYKTIINRARDNATVIIEGETHSFPMATDTILIEYPKMKCSNIKPFFIDTFKTSSPAIEEIEQYKRLVEEFKRITKEYKED